jgi:hypothetical protein
VRFAAAHRLREIESPVVNLALEPAFDEEFQSSGKVISAKKLSAFNFARSEIVKLSNLFNETVAGNDGVGCGEL